MKITQRIPLSQFAYIEFEKEYESEEEAVSHNAQLISTHEAGGLPEREWAKARNNMLKTGEFDPNLNEEMNNAQRYFVNQLKLALRSCKAEDPIVE